MPHDTSWPQETSAPPPGSESFSHVCFAVPDLEAAMAELEEMLGVTFGDPVRSTLGEWPYSLVFTREFPHIELIRSMAGSPWAVDAPTFHHLGLWTSCLPDTLAAWTQQGGSMVFDGREHGRRFAYVDAPRSGARVEAVDIAQRPDFLAQWVTGREAPRSSDATGG